MTIGRKIRRIGAVAAVTTMLGGAGALMAGAAHADPPDPENPEPIAGKVVSKTDLTIRSLPTTDSQGQGKAEAGSTVQLSCKLNGETVDGNKIWFKLWDTDSQWVSARYVDNQSEVPYCD